LISTSPVDRSPGHDRAAHRRREQTRGPLPVTAIYTRTDNVVAWEACIDPDNPHVEHVEVRTSHSGLGFNPEVFRIVARRLAS
jgi:hypothetical protein